MNALHQLVSNSVDYAGLFPPAALSLETVVQNYASYQRQNRNQMLARLIVPASRLEEMRDVCETQSVNPESPWPISALVPPANNDASEFHAGLAMIDAFNKSQRALEKPLAQVDTIEVRVGTPAEVDIIARAMAQRNPSINAFMEIDWKTDPNECLAAIAQHKQPNLFAKIRTGGVTQDLIPPAEKIAVFLLACAKHGVGLKATAGLHHPLRGSYRLTYEDGSDQGRMHGFFNVFLAAAMAKNQTIEDVATLARLLESDTSESFQISETQIQFEEYSVTTKQIEQARSYLVSFGSCSFDEPSNEIDSVFPPASN